MYVAIQPVIALIAGVLILAMPRLLNYIVALYLILVGILGLVRSGAPRTAAPSSRPARQVQSASFACSSG